MKSKEEVTEMALGIGRALCREQEIPLIAQEDCLQEGVAAALRALPHWKGRALLSTFLYWRVRGAIMDYRAKQQNGGMGGRDARVNMVSLQDEVPETYDFDGAPLLYEDIICEEDPPRGLGDPLDELLQDEDEARLQEGMLQPLLQTLSAADRSLIVRYFGIDSPEATQEELALEAGMSQPGVSNRIQKILKKLREEAKSRGYKV